MPLIRLEEVNGTPVVEILFQDTKAEQDWLKRFPKTLQDGFVTVHQWLPGVQSKDRTQERGISRLRMYVAPVVKGKVAMDLGKEIEPGQPVPPVESLEVPEELTAMKDVDLLSLAPAIGAKVSNRMPRPQLLAACARAIQQNPRNWESVRANLAAQKMARETPKPATVGA